jgi:hypothetical protein
MLLFSHGNVHLPDDMLGRLPVDTFVLPGLILGGVIGLSSRVVA